MLKLLRMVALSVAAVSMFAAIPTASQAATTVKVSLWDKGADVEMPKGLLYGTPGDHRRWLAQMQIEKELAA